MPKYQGLDIYNTPNDPLVPRRLVVPDYTESTTHYATPKDSCGWAYLSIRANSGMNTHSIFHIVCDMQYVATFWPAVYDPERDCWVVAGPGWTMKHGQVVKVYELKDYTLKELTSQT